MPKLFDENRKEDPFMGLFLGRPGKGKSIAAASFPEPIYIFDNDGRIGGLVNWFKSKNINKDIDYDTYNSGDLAKANKKLEDLVLNCKYNTVIMDSYTTLADQFLEYSISLRGKDFKGNSTQGKGIIDMPDLGDYKAETSGLAMFMAKFRTIQCKYKILTAHLLLVEYFDVVSKSNKILKSVLTAGKKMTEKVPIYFDEIYEFYTQDHTTMGKAPYYKCRTIPEEGSLLKSSLQLPPEIDWTNKNFYDVIKNEADLKGIKL